MFEICTKLFTKMLNWIDNNIHIIALSVPILLLLVAIYSYINQPHEVTTETQTHAETVQGVQTAADNAKIKLEESQKKEVVETIKEIRTTEQVPVYIVQTTGKEVVKETEKAVKDNKADFAIVTSKDNPDEKIDLEKIPEDTKVELNQYNINAFKKQLNTISYTPQEKVVEYVHQWKVSDSGHYIGAGIAQDLDDNKTYLKVTYTW